MELEQKVMYELKFLEKLNGSEILGVIEEATKNIGVVYRDNRRFLRWLSPRVQAKVTAIKESQNKLELRLELLGRCWFVSDTIKLEQSLVVVPREVLSATIKEENMYAQVCFTPKGHLYGLSDQHIFVCYKSLEQPMTELYMEKLQKEINKQ